MTDHCFTCAICLEFTSENPATDYFVSTAGGHVFHFLCINQYLKNGNESCPLCREPLELSKLTRLYGIRLKRSALTLRLQTDGSDGTLPSLKVVLLGNSTVGKTSLIRRISNQKFVETVNPTCGCDVVFRNIAVGGKVFRLNLWDTAGQENFKSVVSTTLRASNALVLAFDVTEPLTLNDIEAWMEFAVRYTPEDCVRVLVGNKVDLVDERKVSRLVGEAVADKLRIPYFETSAKTGDNVEPLFKAVVGLVLEQPCNNKNEPCNVIELEVDTHENNNKKCFC